MSLPLSRPLLSPWAPKVGVKIDLIIYLYLITNLKSPQFWYGKARHFASRLRETHNRFFSWETRSAGVAFYPDLIPDRLNIYHQIQFCFVPNQTEVTWSFLISFSNWKFYYNHLKITWLLVPEQNCSYLTYLTPFQITVFYINGSCLKRLIG